MFTKHEYACTLKGSLVRIVIPGPCFGEETIPNCAYHLRVAGTQDFQKDLRRNCTEEAKKDPPFDPELYIIIGLAIVLFVVITTIIVNRNRLLNQRSCLKIPFSVIGLPI